MLDWLYGPRFPADASAAGLAMRALTLDIDTLIEVKDEFAGAVRRTLSFERDLVPGTELTYETVATYTLRNREVPEDQVRTLGVPDQNQLLLTVTVEGWASREHQVVPNGTATLTVYCEYALIDARGSFDSQRSAIIAEIADFLYKHGTPRPDWARARWLRSLAPLPFALLAWLWLALTISIPLPLNLLILAVLGMSIVPIYERAKEDLRQAGVMGTTRSFRFRGESRQRTYERRASRRENLKVALYTLPIGALLGVVGTVIADSLTKP